MSFTIESEVVYTNDAAAARSLGADSPACTVKILSSMTAARGSESNLETHGERL